MNDLDKLKSLLFGAEKEALDSISDRVTQPEPRTSDVADVLAEAIHQSHKENSQLVQSLTDPVGECLQQAFRDDPQTYSDALYPVMGPAIRKSIAHTLKEFSQQINQAVEHSLTPKGLKWRLQAARAGIPFGDFVLQKTLLYRVEQAYLISRENGLLIDHVHHSASKIKDSDAVSAMFTAIQDFIKESFTPDKTGRLESADMGEFTLWAVHGPHALLVCVIRGVPPKNLRGELSAVLEKIHFRYGDAVRSYNGDPSSVSGVEAELQECLELQATQKVDDAKRGTPWPLIIIVSILVAATAYLYYGRWTDANELQNLSTAIRETPGLYLASADRDGDNIVVRGMRDPLAPSIAEIASGIGLAPDSIVADVSPFQSLDPALIRKRVDLAIGELETADYDFSGATVTITGSASRSWLDTARNRILQVAGVDTVDVSSVVDLDVEKLKSEIVTLSGTRFIFVSDVGLAPAQQSAIRELAQKLSTLQARADASDHNIGVTIIGSTDMSGDAESNAILSIRRAELVATIMAEYGVIAQDIRQADAPVDSTVSGLNTALRNASVELELTPSTESL